MGPPKCSAPTTRRKETLSSRRAARRFRPWSVKAACCWRTSEFRCRRSPLWCEASKKLAAENEIIIALVAHAGDGNTHPIIVYDRADPSATARAQTAFGSIMDLAIELGGTITGEHGVGRSKAPWLAAYLGDDVMALNRRIKDALDPAGILNPGAILAARD